MERLTLDPLFCSVDNTRENFTLGKYFGATAELLTFLFVSFSHSFMYSHIYQIFMLQAVHTQVLWYCEEKHDHSAAELAQLCHSLIFLAILQVLYKPDEMD